MPLGEAAIEAFDDLYSLSESKLPPKLVELITHARLEAREIIRKLKPADIGSWEGLIDTLEQALKTARLHHFLLTYVYSNPNWMNSLTDTSARAEAVVQKVLLDERVQKVQAVIKTREGRR